MDTTIYSVLCIGYSSKIKDREGSTNLKLKQFSAYFLLMANMDCFTMSNSVICKHPVQVLHHLYLILELLALSFQLIFRKMFLESKKHLIYYQLEELKIVLKVLFFEAFYKYLHEDILIIFYLSLADTLKSISCINQLLMVHFFPQIFMQYILFQTK